MSPVIGRFKMLTNVRTDPALCRRLQKRNAALSFLALPGLIISMLLTSPVEADKLPLSKTHEVIAKHATFWPGLLVMRSGDRIRICNKDTIVYMPFYGRIKLGGCTKGGA